MIQSRDDVFVFDSCRRRGETEHPLEFRVYKNGHFSEGLRIYSTIEREVLQVISKCCDFVLFVCML